MIRGVTLTVLLFLNLLFWGTPVLLGGVVKLLTIREPRRRVILSLAWLAERWMGVNVWLFATFLDTEWDVEGVDDLRADGHYLLVSNHISWVDIFAVLHAFHGRTAFIRFFLKQPLIWFPIVGQASWALEFPFMRRYTPEYLEKHPEKRGRDLETTRLACRRYRRIPVTILNFAEGTRFTREKQEDQQSPFRWLLRPRAGGISFVLASLSEQLDGFLDVTIAYPGHEVSAWELVTNRIPRVFVRVRRLELPPELATDAITEPGPAREQFKQWLEQVWRDKDDLIDRLIA